MSLLDEEYYDDAGLCEALKNRRTGKKPTKRTTKGWRDRRTGPPVTYILGKPHYRKEAVKEWLLSLEGRSFRKQHRLDKERMNGHSRP